MIEIIVNDKKFTDQEANDLLVRMLSALGLIDTPGGMEWQRRRESNNEIASKRLGVLHMLEAASHYNYTIEYGPWEENTKS